MQLTVVILPEFRWSDARGVWRRAEELGFGTAWTYDHLSWQMLRDQAWFGALPTLTAAAGVTGRIRLGTLVASPTFRHPVPFAKELITLDDVSGGRVTLGLGAGGTGYDATTLRPDLLSARDRTARFAEFVELTDLLLREPVADFTGQWFSAHQARNYPGCVQRPRIPFAVAGNGPRGMRLAARYGQAWVTTGVAPDGGGADEGNPLPALRGQLDRLQEACDAEDRDPATLDRLVVTGFAVPAALESVERFRDSAGRLAELGFTHLAVHWPRPEPPLQADRGVFEAAVTAMTGV